MLLLREGRCFYRVVLVYWFSVSEQSSWDGRGGFVYPEENFILLYCESGARSESMLAGGFSPLLAHELWAYAFYSFYIYVYIQVCMYVAGV